MRTVTLFLCTALLFCTSPKEAQPAPLPEPSKVEPTRVTVYAKFKAKLNGQEEPIAWMLINTNPDEDEREDRCVSLMQDSTWVLRTKDEDDPPGLCSIGDGTGKIEDGQLKGFPAWAFGAESAVWSKGPVALMVNKTKITTKPTKFKTPTAPVEGKQ